MVIQDQNKSGHTGITNIFDEMDETGGELEKIMVPGLFYCDFRLSLMFHQTDPKPKCHEAHPDDRHVAEHRFFHAFI
jgi:hypothetical protein